MVNRISAAGLQVRQYFHRYTDDALDLCDVLASYVPGGSRVASQQVLALQITLTAGAIASSAASIHFIAASIDSGSTTRRPSWEKTRR
jgi:hypothetical protein